MKISTLVDCGRNPRSAVFYPVLNTTLKEILYLIEIFNATTIVSKRYGRQQP